MVKKYHRRMAQPIYEDKNLINLEQEKQPTILSLKLHAYHKNVKCEKKKKTKEKRESVSVSKDEEDFKHKIEDHFP